MKRNKENDFIINDTTCRRLADEVATHLIGAQKAGKILDYQMIQSTVYLFIKRDKNNRTTD